MHHLCHGYSHACLRDSVHGRANEWSVQDNFSGQVTTQIHLEAKGPAKDQTACHQQMQGRMHVLCVACPVLYLVGPKVNMTRVENEIIICIAKALTKQPSC